MTQPALELRIDGLVAELRLAAAADGLRLARDLADTAAALHEARDVRCALLLSASEAFGPVEMDLSGEAPDLRLLETLPQPVIAVIEGRCAGAGLEVALACDLRVASAGATFAVPQVRDGRLPALGGTQRLPRLIGRARAMEMILLGTELDARAAAACGLVNHVAASGPARDAAMPLVSAICERGPIAIGYAKEAVLRGLDMPLEQALRYETDLTVILQTTADRDEGVRAFLEKRDPNFEGR